MVRVQDLGRGLASVNVAVHETANDHVHHIRELPVVSIGLEREIPK
jgi:hypothetical protein